MFFISGHTDKLLTCTCTCNVEYWLIDFQVVSLTMSDSSKKIGMEWIPLNLGHFIEIELYVMYMEIGVDMGISVTPLTSKVLEHSCVRCGQGHCLN